MDAEMLSGSENSLHTLSIAVDKLVGKSGIFDNRLNWIEGKVTMPLDYKIDHQHVPPESRSRWCIMQCTVDGTCVNYSCV